MFVQIAIGSVLLLITIAVAGLSFWAMEITVVRMRGWFLRPPHRPKLMLMLSVSYTTLGFGDVLLPQEWRLLSGMAAVNGLLNIGLVTAFLVEGLRQVRLSQIAETEGSK